MSRPGKARHLAYFRAPVSRCACLFDDVIGSQHQMSQRIGRLLGGLAAASAFALLATACSSGGQTQEATASVTGRHWPIARQALDTNGSISEPLPSHSCW